MDEKFHYIKISQEPQIPLKYLLAWERFEQESKLELEWILRRLNEKDENKNPPFGAAG